MRKLICLYCGKEAVYVDSKEIYGRSYGMIYLCRECDAYVGVHNGTDKPLGRLANKELRQYKMAAHAAFDPIWKSEAMSRHKAYDWLSSQINLPIAETHIGMFDVERCKRVIKICNEWSDKNA